MNLEDEAHIKPAVDHWETIPDEANLKSLARMLLENEAGLGKIPSAFTLIKILCYLEHCRGFKEAAAIIPKEDQS